MLSVLKFIALSILVLLFQGCVSKMDLAMTRGDLETIKSEINENPSYLYTKNKYGYLPIDYAVIMNHLDIIDYLLTRGIDVNEAIKISIQHLKYLDTYEAKGADPRHVKNLINTKLHTTEHLLKTGGEKVNYSTLDTKGLSTPAKNLFIKYEAISKGNQNPVLILTKAELNRTEGTRRTKNGVYRGGLKKGKYNKQGTFIWNDGRKLVGKWSLNYIVNGIYMQPDGITYIGNFYSNYGEELTLQNLQGKGELRLANGKKYIGVLGDKNQPGIILDSSGNALLGTINLQSSQPIFTEFSRISAREKLLNKNYDNTFVVKNNIASIKYLDDIELSILKSQQEEILRKRAQSDAEYEIKICNDNKKRLLNKLNKIAKIVSEMKCSTGSSWDEIDNLDKHLNKVSTTHVKNKEDSRFWIEHLRDCVKELRRDMELEYESRKWTYERADNNCKNKDDIDDVESIIAKYDEYIDYGESRLQNASDYANQRENGVAAQVRQENAAHEARMKADFVQWSNDLRSSTNKTLNDLSDVSRNTHKAMEERRTIQPTYNDRTYKTKTRVSQDSTYLHREQVKKQKKEQFAEREIEQYKREVKISTPSKAKNSGRVTKDYSDTARGSSKMCYSESIAVDLAKTAAENTLDEKCRSTGWYGATKVTFGATIDCTACSSNQSKCSAVAKGWCYK